MSSLRHQLFGLLEEHRAQIRIDLVHQTGQRIAFFLGLAAGGTEHLGGFLQQILAAHFARFFLGRCSRFLRLGRGSDFRIPASQQGFHAGGGFRLGRRLDARGKFAQHPVDHADGGLHAGLHGLWQLDGGFTLLEQQLFQRGSNATHLHQPHVTGRATSVCSVRTSDSGARSASDACQLDQSSFMRTRDWAASALKISNSSASIRRSPMRTCDSCAPEAGWAGVADVWTAAVSACLAAVGAMAGSAATGSGAAGASATSG